MTDQEADQWAAERVADCSDDDFAQAQRVRRLREQGDSWLKIGAALGLGHGKTGASRARRAYRVAFGYYPRTRSKRAPAIRSGERSVSTRTGGVVDLDGPKANRDPEFLSAKIARLNEPHIAPINDLVREIREAMDRPDVPFIDPTLGGVNARVMFLLEAPSANAAYDSGILSPDNDSDTAAHIWRLYRDSGLSRDRCVHWNAAPWYIGDGLRIRPPSSADINDGLPWLGRLIHLLPDLQLVVTMGEPARTAFARYLPGDPARLIYWLAVPHPSKQGVIKPGAPALQQSAFRIAALLTRGTVS